MATHATLLAWRIPGTEEAGGLQSTWSQRVGHTWATSIEQSSSLSPSSWTQQDRKPQGCWGDAFHMNVELWLQGSLPMWVCGQWVHITVTSKTRGGIAMLSLVNWWFVGSGGASSLEVTFSGVSFQQSSLGGNIYHCACVFSCVRLFLTPGTVARQAPLSMGFSRQEHWSGLPFPTPGHHPNLGINPLSLASHALSDGFFTTAPTGKLYVP